MRKIHNKKCLLLSLYLTTLDIFFLRIARNKVAIFYLFILWQKQAS